MDEAERDLNKYAQFGGIPFDLYALEHWDYAVSREEDGRQWKEVGQRFLALPPAERRPYRYTASRVRDQPGNDWSHLNLTPANVDRVLRPFQTVRERNVSVLVREDPPWVRLCYDAALAEKYVELQRAVGFGGHSDAVIEALRLDDPERYDFGDDLEIARASLLERIPSLCDANVDPDNHPTSEEDQSLEALSDRMVLAVYIADREAIAKGLVKIMWLDIHGRSLMVNQISPRLGSIARVTSQLSQGFSMEEIVEETLPAFEE